MRSTSRSVTGLCVLLAACGGQGGTAPGAAPGVPQDRKMPSMPIAPASGAMDIHAVDQAYAPGVSAPASGGMPPQLWLMAAHEAGRNLAVTSADIVETNPALDRDGQTARLAALTVWWILRGIAERADPI